jgi:amidohydrolase
MKKILILLLLSAPLLTSLTPSVETLKEKVISLAEENEDQVIEWRHYFHQYPELSNREFKTARIKIFFICSLK